MLMALFLMGIGVAMAQTQVQGTIVDEQGEAVIGASVLVKGTSTGTVTNLDGQFTLSAPANGTLVISYVGMQTMEVAVSPKVRVVLHSDAELLDEVVVTERKRQTGTTQQLDVKDMKNTQMLIKQV